MRESKSFAALLVVIALSWPAAAVAQQEPCEAEYRGALLVARLSDILQAAGPLRLLNGTENPRLKRVLQWQLATAAAEARRHISEGAELSPIRLTSFAEGVDRAIQYVATNPIDADFLKEMRSHADVAYPPNGNLENVAENLAFVAEFLRKHNERVE